MAKEPAYTEARSRAKADRLTVPLAILVLLGLALVLFRLMLPDLVRNHLNEQMTDMGQYSGHAETVRLQLWRGSYSIENLQISLANQDTPAPFLDAPGIDLTVSWRDLWKGRFVAEATFHSPVINLVDLGDGEFQTGGEVDWRQRLEDLMPIEFNHVKVHDGSMHFRAFHTEPPVDLEVSEIEVTASDISTQAGEDGTRISTIEATALVLNHARAELESRFDPLGDFTDFDLAFRATDIDLTHLNTLTMAYANFDFQAGQAALVMELEARDARLSGYARPILDQVEISDFEETMEQEGLLHALWEGVLEVASQILRARPEDRLAAEIEISGELGQEEVSGWQAFVSILRNAFVEAYSDAFGQES